MPKVDIKAIIKDFDKDELQNLISIAQGVLTSLFSSDEIKELMILGMSIRECATEI